MARSSLDSENASGIDCPVSVTESLNTIDSCLPIFFSLILLGKNIPLGPFKLNSSQIKRQ